MVSDCIPSATPEHDHPTDFCHMICWSTVQSQPPYDIPNMVPGKVTSHFNFNVFNRHIYVPRTSVMSVRIERSLRDKINTSCFFSLQSVHDSRWLCMLCPEL